MFHLKNLTLREYQESIFQTAKSHNTLAVLETGLGKTAIALKLSLHFLSQDISKKVIILAPSRPLISQHHRYFLHHSNLESKEVSLITGKIPPSQRKKLFKESFIIFSTPQCINNDLKNNLISLEDVILIVFDEAHHAVQNYAYVNISRTYQNIPGHHMLALTASPGNNKKKINEICKNLSIEKVEIRTDQEVKQYLQEKHVSWLTIPLDEQLLNIIAKIKQYHTSKLKELKHLGVTKPLNLINKKDLLDLQIKFRSQLSRRNPIAFHGISLSTLLIKTSHLIDILETQGITTTINYLKKIEQETSKASKSILISPYIRLAYSQLIELSKKQTHPKISSLSSIISSQLEENKNSKIIVFVNFRDTINEILNAIKNVTAIRPVILIGQKSGLSQKQQVEVIKEFEKNVYNVLICTSIGEEGLSIGTLDIAIFYDAVPSAIRRIQRTGRVARLKSGKIIHLMTAGSKDVAYYWKSQRDEAKMKNILYNMQDKEKQSTL